MRTLHLLTNRYGVQGYSVKRLMATIALSVFVAVPSLATAMPAVSPSVAVRAQAMVFAQQDKPSNRPSAQDGSPQEPIQLDFDDTPLMEVLSSIGALTGRNFEVDPTLNNEKVTIISHYPLPPQLAYEILETVFKSRGWVMEESLGGDLVTIKKGVAPEASKLPIIKDGLAHDGYDNHAIHIIQPKFISAADAAEVLKTVGSKDVVPIVFESTNTLIMIDTADGIRNMYEVLSYIDVPGYNVSTEIFILKHTRAEALIEQLNEVLLGDGGEQAGGRPGQAQPRNIPARTSRTPANTPQETNVIGNSEEVLRMVPDERLNALIVVATPNMMDQVKEMIGYLDTPTPVEKNNMHYVALMHTDAESVAGVLEAVTSSAPRESATKGTQDGEIQPFEKKVIITTYEDNNALVIIASPQDFEVLQKLITDLDTPRQQVSVSAVVMEVTLNDGFDLRVESAVLDESSFFALSNVVNIASVITGGPGTVAGAGGTIGIIDGTTEVSFDGVVTEVPNVPLLMKALETLTDVEILSKPNLMMKNNTEGKLISGSEIGLPTSQSDINPNSGFQSRNSIQRRDVGIVLTVTPQINEGGYVTMEIEVESSDTDPGSLNTDTGAVITKSNVTSEVVVKDGQTGIIGGLIREKHSRGKSQVPVLGDIPVVGNLFKTRSNNRAKQNLVVLVTPTIVTREEDLARVSKKGLDDFYTYRLDAMFEKGGVIKKTKAKYHARSKTRPSDTYAPSENEGVIFKNQEQVESIEAPADEAKN
jgi:general secretion pathway protein D